MRIAFVNPPFLPKYSRSQRSPGVIKSGTLYYPYWLAHAAAWAESKGHEIDLIDAPAAGMELSEVLAKIAAFDPGLVVVDTSTPSIYADIECAQAVKKALPQTFVTLCGTHASARPEQVMEGGGVDAVLLGEYDLTAAELADALETGEMLNNVPGLHVQGIGETAPRELIEDLDDLPPIAPVYKGFLNVQDYYFSLASHPMVMLITGRGCPNNCFFCLYPQVMHGRKYRRRSPLHIVKEVEYIAREMPEVREIVFEDDTFTADQGRTIRFCELLLERGIRIPWFANVRVDTKPETLKIMKQAGFRSCAVGFESGTQGMLDTMGKNITVEKAKVFMREAKKLGILVHGCFMVGFPGETRETMERTLAYAIQLDPDSAQFYPIFPYPGTESYAWAESNGFLRTTDYRRWLTADGGHAGVIDLPDLPAESIWDFCEKAYRRFHFRPKYLAKKMIQAILRPKEGLRSVRSFMYYMGYLLKGDSRS